MDNKTRKEKLLSESCGVCVYCGHKVDFNTMEVEHIIPLSKGGPDIIENNVCSCHECNASKKDMLPQEFYAAMTPKRHKAFLNRLNNLALTEHMTLAKRRLLLNGKPRPVEILEDNSRIQIELGQIAWKSLVLVLSIKTM